jgi:lipopolysaccharide/colanic/teichoic acid biosynthesis glycosyltransferase
MKERDLLSEWSSRCAKRSLDLAGAATSLALLAVPFAVLSVAIKLDSPGPVFYRGERVGRHGETFRIFKFRSMRVASGGPDTTSDADARITRVGRFIRRYKLDELSQLINVVIGDMSLVGPRPEVKWCVDLYTDEEKAILEVRPGITDFASIRFHNEGEIIERSGYADPDQAYLALIRPEKLRLQLKYVRERSIRTDLAIIVETLSTLVRTRALASSELGGAH